MVTNLGSWACDNNFILNTVLAKSPVQLYQIPMLSALGTAVSQVNFDIHDSREYSIELGSNLSDTENFDGGVFGRLKNVCSTECAVIRTKVLAETLSLRALCAEYAVDNLVCSPSYGVLESLDAILPEIRNTSARQIEKFGYIGYSGVSQMKNIPGLRGLLDISTAFAGPPALPIDATDYGALCQFFTNGINQVRKGALTSGYEFLKSDISVHVASDVVDKINCSILSATTIGLWEKLSSSVLSQTAGGTAVVTDQISNQVFFVNNKRISGKYNYILKNGMPYSFKMKTFYPLLLGTISFNPTSSVPPVVFADNVLA